MWTVEKIIKCKEILNKSYSKIVFLGIPVFASQITSIESGPLSAVTSRSSSTQNAVAVIRLHFFI